jgi:hypothetical protein
MKLTCHSRFSLAAVAAGALLGLGSSASAVTVLIQDSTLDTSSIVRTVSALSDDTLVTDSANFEDSGTQTPLDVTATDVDVSVEVRTRLYSRIEQVNDDVLFALSLAAIDYSTSGANEDFDGSLELSFEFTVDSGTPTFDFGTAFQWDENDPNEDGVFAFSLTRLDPDPDTEVAAGGFVTSGSGGGAMVSGTLSDSAVLETGATYLFQMTMGLDDPPGSTQGGDRNMNLLVPEPSSLLSLLLGALLLGIRRRRAS